MCEEEEEDEDEFVTPASSPEPEPETEPETTAPVVNIRNRIEPAAVPSSSIILFETNDQFFVYYFPVVLRIRYMIVPIGIRGGKFQVLQNQVRILSPIAKDLL